LLGSIPRPAFLDALSSTIFREETIMRAITFGALLATALVGATSSAAAGENNKALEIGKPAPAWKDLIGIDDKKHGLDDLKKASVVVVAFTCNHCPVAQAYEDRLNKLAKEYKGKGVELVAINVNNLPEDKLDKMKERASEKRFAFSYLYDPTQKIGRAYDAAVTPHLFVLDKDRKVAYMGAFDDNQDASQAKKHYIRDAVDALLAGKKPAVAETKQFGCGIKYDSK